MSQSPVSIKIVQTAQVFEYVAATIGMLVVGFFSVKAHKATNGVTFVWITWACGLTLVSIILNLVVSIGHMNGFFTHNAFYHILSLSDLFPGVADATIFIFLIELPLTFLQHLQNRPALRRNIRFYTFFISAALVVLSIAAFAIRTRRVPTRYTALSEYMRLYMIFSWIGVANAAVYCANSLLYIGICYVAASRTGGGKRTRGITVRLIIATFLNLLHASWQLGMRFYRTPSNPLSYLPINAVEVLDAPVSVWSTVIMLGLLASIGWIFPGKDSGEQDEFNQQQPWLAEVTYGNVYHASCEQIQGPGQEPCTFARHIQQQPAEVHGQSRPGGWAELPGCVVYELPDNNQQQRLVSVEDALRERP